MSNIPDDLHYTESHEWVRANDDGSLTVGITHHAQDLLGDMVYIELPEAGADVSAGKDCAVVESVKAASDIYAPVSGVVTRVNESLRDAPETVNSDPYGEGWIFRMEPGNADDVDALLDAAAYEQMVAEEQ